MSQKKLLIVSDFNTANLCNIINNSSSNALLKADQAPFGQVYQVLSSIEEYEGFDYLLVWVRPEVVFNAYRSRLFFKHTVQDEISAEVNFFLSQLATAAKNFKKVFVATFNSPQYETFDGSLAFTNGVKRALYEMNIQLIDEADKNGYMLLDPLSWIIKSGSTWFNSKLWFMAKIPYNNKVFIEAGKDIVAEVNALLGNTKKVLVLDLDDTLWGGIVGDVGWENLRLGGHDQDGEAFVDFQHELKRLKERGIVLCIVSKNEELTALDAIDRHPEMVLKKEDFAGYRINWVDKAENIRSLAEELNLGLQSFVFLDDNPIERDRVKNALPEVMVPDMPIDKLMYREFLLSLDCFRIPKISNEDKERTAQYLNERKRKEDQDSVGSLDEWLQSLGIKIIIEPLNAVNLQRANQLLNKTNQLNMRTRRLTEEEMKQWAAESNNHLWTVRVLDKYGDSGLTGIISLSEKDGIGYIEDYVLSCRVMGRGVEKSMLYFIYEYCKDHGISKMVAEFIHTPKNKPCYDFFVKDSGFDNNNDVFSYSIDRDYLKPAHIEIENKTNG